MANALIVLVAILMVFSGSVAAEAAGPPVPISGTFSKGPAVGGVDRFVGPNVLQVRGEQGFGTITGGVLTGAAPTAETAIVSGTWRVISATGPDAGLHGEGHFTGVEVFKFGPHLGETEGVFSGLVH